MYNTDIIVHNIITAAWNKGMKHAEIEKKVGVAPGYLARIKAKNSDMGIKKLLQFSLIVNVPVEVLLLGWVESTRESEKLTKLKEKRELLNKEIEELEKSSAGGNNAES